MKKLFPLLGVLISIIYIINPTGGIVEFLPDNLPIIGNLDEAFFVGLLIYCMRKLGYDLITFKKLPPSIKS